MFIIDIFKIKVNFGQYRNYKSDSNLCDQVITSKGSVKGGWKKEREEDMVQLFYNLRK